MSNRPVKVIAGIACATAVVAAGAFGVTAANADPISQAAGTAAPATYVAVGSDTIQSLYDGFANGFGTTPAAASISSWLATGSTKVVPSNAFVPSGANAIFRPANSGDGRIALSAAWNPSNANANLSGGNSVVTPHSIDIARSSGAPSHPTANGGTSTGGSDDNLVSVPLARDAVAVAVNGVPAIDGVIKAGTLAAIYRAPDNSNNGVPSVHEGIYQQVTATDTAGDVKVDTATSLPEVYGSDNAWHDVQPYLPTNGGSGTRQFFQTAIGLGKSDAAQTGVRTTADGTSTGATIIENTGALVAHVGDIAPFSAAQWIAQKNGAATNTVSDSNIHLDAIGGLAPTSGTAPTLTPGALFGDTSSKALTGFGIFDRDVYSVVATAEFKDALKTLVTTTLPSSPAVSFFGFDPIAAVSASSANWIHSSWENSGTAADQPTTTSVQVTALAGDQATLTATVSGGAFTVNAGTVTFKDGSAVLGAPVAVNAFGVATWTGTLAAGSHSLTAAYAHGDSTPAPTAASTSAPLALTTAAGAVQLAAGTPTIAGSAKVGSTLTASATGATAGATVAYQWSANGAAIANATSPKLVVPASAKGKTITVSVAVYQAGAISAASTSAATTAVAAGTLKVGKPTITGTAKVGKTLTVKPGTWTTGTKLKFQWLSNGKTIKGATKSTLKVSASLKAKKISVKVTGSLTGYTAKPATSKTTKAVAK